MFEGFLTSAEVLNIFPEKIPPFASGEVNHDLIYSTPSAHSMADAR